MIEKVHITYSEICQLISDSVGKIRDFSPDYILALGGGGLVPARILREYVDVPVLVVTAKSYTNENQSGELKIIQWLDSLSLEAVRGKRVLIVDEIYDTGKTLHLLAPRFGDLGAGKLGLFLLHQKDTPDRLPLSTVYEQVFIGSQIENKWIVYPWETTFF